MYLSVSVVYQLIQRILTPLIFTKSGEEVFGVDQEEEEGEEKGDEGQETPHVTMIIVNIQLYIAAWYIGYLTRRQRVLHFGYRNGLLSTFLCDNN